MPKKTVLHLELTYEDEWAPPNWDDFLYICSSEAHAWARDHGFTAEEISAAYRTKAITLTITPSKTGEFKRMREPNSLGDGPSYYLCHHDVLKLREATHVNSIYVRTPFARRLPRTGRFDITVECEVE